MNLRRKLREVKKERERGRWKEGGREDRVEGRDGKWKEGRGGRARTIKGEGRRYSLLAHPLHHLIEENIFPVNPFYYIIFKNALCK